MDGSGLYRKYRVERVDGKPVDWCFVLQDTDPLAVPALLAYAKAAEAAGETTLAFDLYLRAHRMDAGRGLGGSQDLARVVAVLEELREAMRVAIDRAEDAQAARVELSLDEAQRFGDLLTEGLSLVRSGSLAGFEARCEL